jgi:hypothetical protein
MILRPVPPFRLDLTVWALRRRARNAIDRWNCTTDRRVVMGGPGARRANRGSCSGTAATIPTRIATSWHGAASRRNWPVAGGRMGAAWGISGSSCGS